VKRSVFGIMVFIRGSFLINDIVVELDFVGEIIGVADGAAIFYAVIIPGPTFNVTETAQNRPYRQRSAVGNDVPEA